MLQIRQSSIAFLPLWVLGFSAACVPAGGQSAPPSDTSTANTRLALKAALVLTPEFCASKNSQGSYWTNGKDTFFVGKSLCAKLEPILDGVFSDLRRVADTSSIGDAQVVLVPRVVNVSKSQHFATIDIIAQLEWTVIDSSGKTVWVDTVEGHATDKGKNFGEDYAGLLNRTTNDAMNDLVTQSASQMAASLELRKFAQQLAPAAATTPSPAPADIPNAARPGFLLAQGTEVALAFDQDVIYKTAVEGDSVQFVLAEDIKVGDVVVAKAGCKAVGFVTNAKNSAGMIGKAGELNIRIDYLMVGDVKVKLLGVKGKDIESGSGSARAGGVLFGSAKHTSNTDIKKGTPFRVNVAESVSLPPLA